MERGTEEKLGEEEATVGAHREQEAGARLGRVPARIKKKHIDCKYWMEGSCRFSEEFCNFKHEPKMKNTKKARDSPRRQEGSRVQDQSRRQDQDVRNEHQAFGGALAGAAGQSYTAGRGKEAAVTPQYVMLQPTVVSSNRILPLANYCRSEEI